MRHRILLRITTIFKVKFSILPSAAQWLVYVPAGLPFSSSYVPSVHRVSVICIDLRTHSSYYIPIQHRQVNFYSRKGECSLRGTNFLTYLLHGAESFLRSQRVLQLIKKFPAFYGTTRKFITVLTSVRHLSLS